MADKIEIFYIPDLHKDLPPNTVFKFIHLLSSRVSPEQYIVQISVFFVYIRLCEIASICLLAYYIALCFCTAIMLYCGSVVSLGVVNNKWPI